MRPHEFRVCIDSQFILFLCVRIPIHTLRRKTSIVIRYCLFISLKTMRRSKCQHIHEDVVSIRVSINRQLQQLLCPNPHLLGKLYCLLHTSIKLAVLDAGREFFQEFFRFVIFRHCKIHP